jgi:RNA polymerase sigma factor (sigma-70 family)
MVGAAFSDCNAEGRRKKSWTFHGAKSVLSDRRPENDMTAKHLSKALHHLRCVLRPPSSSALTDGQLLARFVTSRDEAAFNELVRRHGPMVLGVCRRILRHTQDAEDAFQAAFLVLARKAASVVNRHAVGSWLFRVSYRIAVDAKAINDKRRRREKQVEEMPHPEVSPIEPKDWLPRLDNELNLLPEHYRAVIVACDLEGMSGKEAARLMDISEGTVSSRLARGRCLLAKRLSRSGLSLSVGALTAELAEGSVSAPVSVSLLSSTTKAVLGQAILSNSVEILMKGALKIMLLTKLKLAVGAVMVMVALGTSGLVYRASGQSTPAITERKPDGKPRTELEALRRENELLKLNLEVVLEKVRAQEAELRGLKARASQPQPQRVELAFSPDGNLAVLSDGTLRLWDRDTGKQLSNLAAIKPDGKQELLRTVDTLEKSLKELREQLKKQQPPPQIKKQQPPPPGK